jgi:phospho-N-acetylmuramoyl-pentapeptide-transferase
MLYYLFEYLDKTLNISGTEFSIYTFRSALAYTILVVVYDLWKRIIRFLQNQQVGAVELGLAGQNEKQVRQPWELNYYIRYSGLLCCLQSCKIFT